MGSSPADRRVPARSILLLVLFLMLLRPAPASAAEREPYLFGWASASTVFIPNSVTVPSSI